jgi:hypothetical protein
MSRNGKWDHKSEHDPELELGDVEVGVGGAGAISAAAGGPAASGSVPTYERTNDVGLVKSAEAKSPRRMSGYHQMI